MRAPKTFVCCRGRLMALLIASLIPLLGQATSWAEEGPVELGLKGYCQVSYHTTGKAIPGDVAHRSDYQGWTYLFADAEAKKKFDAEPEKYLPQFGGLCTTALGGSYGNRLPSDPEVFHVVEGKLYLFSSMRARNAFDTKPQEYIAKANALYAKPELNGYCPVSYQLAHKAVKGDAQYGHVFRGKVYHLASEDVKAAFAKDGAKYIPQYGGSCAEGAARNKRYAGDPSIFLVLDGKTYLFFDDKAKATFEANATQLTQAADANWPELKNAKSKP